MGLFEILLIVVVTLLVVGPERMPETVRSVALTIGRMKRFFNDARQEIEKQVGADEIRQQLHNEAVMEQLAKVEEFSTQEGVMEQLTSAKPSIADTPPPAPKPQSSLEENEADQEEYSILNDQAKPSSERNE